MEFYSNNYVRSSSIKSSSSPTTYNSKRFLRSANLIREYRDFKFYDHAKRNLKGTNVNSDSSVNNENANNLITYEHLGESWIELVLPFTILGITLLGVVLIGVILFIWIRKYFSKTREKCQTRLQSKNYCSEKKSAAKINRKMNSRKWLRGRSKQVDSQVVGDLEQKLETVEFKNSPPTSPNSQKQSDDEQQSTSGESDSEGGTDILNEQEDLQDKDEDDDGEEKSTKTNPIILPSPLAISGFSASNLVHPQPSGSSETQVQQVTPSSSSLSLLQEEVHCIQPREDQTHKMYKSIATSPPPFSPIFHQHSSHKYATTGTQTYFTKAPNSPNNHLLSSSFAVLQTPTTSTIPCDNPFALPSSENKENKEPSTIKLRNSCLNKAISNFKQDNCETSSSPTSPSSVISTSPKLATSPKINTNVLQQQNSPLIQSGDSPPISRQFNFSPKVLPNTNSPTIASANYKFGNYFRFPDVGTPPVPPLTARTDDKSSSSSSSLNKQSSTNTSDESTDVATKSFQNLSMESDKESIILKIDEVESPVIEVKSPSVETSYNNFNNNNIGSGNTLTIRRARLKSISLDSDGARLVEENLTMPVEELVEIASYNDKQITDSEPTDSATSSSANNNNNRYNPKNIYNLTINLDFRDSSLDVTEGSDINMNQDHEYDETDDGIIRTPTMKYFRNKKAVSLDSDNQEGGKGAQQFAGKTASTETFNYYFGQTNSKMNSSISVPSTPKHLPNNKLKISSSDERSGHVMSTGRYSRKLGSFEENQDGQKHHMGTTQAQQVYKSNLTASIQTLNVSSSNLKTLPEIMSVSDFDGQPPKPGPRVGPPIGIPPSKSGILQRRGSNQSLTLNVDGSCGNLARGLSCSNYSLGNIHGSHLSIAGSNQQVHRSAKVKENLFKRRVSNTSLTLNVQESNNNLNRYNSHSSLNIAGSKHQGLLERRNSNASLTLNIQNRGLSISNCNLRGSECSLSSVNTNQMTDLMMMEQEAEQEAEEQAAKDQENCNSRHQRKFLSSENLNNFSAHSRCAMSSGNHHRQQVHQTPYGSIDNLKHSQPYDKLPVISTKPLSPQSTSEDFKIYLANIQFLQSASNVLDEENLRTLNALFQKSYKTQPKVSTEQTTQFNNDDILNNRIGNDGPPMSFASSSPDEDQKELLIKLHQEFWNLPTNYQEKPMVFGSQPKNRYKTILPNEHSRVILQREEGCQQEPYINANFIKVRN